MRINNNNILTNGLANGTNIPNEITPNNGPPNKPNILRDICNTVLPKYSHEYDKPIVIRPKKAANNLDILVDLCSFNGDLYIDV
jgi:hypothetical protein